MVRAHGRLLLATDLLHVNRVVLVRGRAGLTGALLAGGAGVCEPDHAGAGQAEALAGAHLLVFRAVTIATMAARAMRRK
jgi:hypothetical protein